MYLKYLMMGPGESSRCNDSLQARLFGVGIPVEAAFSASVEGGAGTHSASYIMGNG
jgi:hypothetical protein